MVTVNTGSSAMTMANEMFGNGVTVVGASYTGDSRSSGVYSDANALAPGVAPSDTGVILSTGRAVDFIGSGSNPNQSSSTSTNTGGINNDSDFNALVGSNTYDAAWLDVDFVPTGNTMTMQFVFSSDEYPEYSNTLYNDAVGVWVNGSPATLGVGDGSTTVGNVNQIDNINLYKDNTGDAYNTEIDGFTVTMTLTMTVIPNVVNSIRIGIADVADSSYDSNLLIAGDSLQTVLIANDDSIRLDPNTSKTIDVLDNDYSASAASLTITHINGIAVVANSTVTLPNGQAITLNADGTFTIVADGDVEIAPFTYTISDGVDTDSAFVTVSTVPCFVSGTMIQTPNGERRVETLKVGDLVTTHDNGAQPIRWVGSRKALADEDHAPIRIAAHTFGVHRTLLVSPQHRVLIRDALSELMFGEPEVLIAAKHLLNDRTVTRQIGGTVEYVHLLFDEHQVIFSEGLPTESFLPGPQTTDGFEEDVLAELVSIFPELDPETGEGYGQSARRALKSYEAMVLMTQYFGATPLGRPDQLARAA